MSHQASDGQPESNVRPRMSLKGFVCLPSSIAPCAEEAQLILNYSSGVWDRPAEILRGVGFTMVLRRKQARGRPPKDTSSHSPPPRRAKAVANANIAAIMMDTDGPSAKIPKLDLNDKPHAESSRSTSKVKEEDTTVSAQNSETCAVCLGQRVDPTELDNCVHSFCFACTSQWFKYSEKCPLCMTPTKTFYHSLKSPNGKEAYVNS
ncbi:zinc finger, C3HC4 type [Oesophagostomum dentatum]|uniref:RING-type E3 ubiquitin transferase n=1 Tax=Oesophagostomum dentatum TaxID=61180 RepID=A0A0B1SUV0_OESDE|nr:zinc finger, C3HC4 type [Oesophagostomum dentatum]